MANKNAPPKLDITIPSTDSGPYGLGATGDKTVQHANSLVGAPHHANVGGKGGLTVNQILDYMHTLQTTNPAQLASLQQLLYRGGFYPANYTFLPGVIKKQDQAAMIDALKQVANTPGQSFLDYLTNAAAVGDQLGINNSAGSQRAPLVTRYTPETDIQSVVESVAPQVIGRNLAPGEVARIVSGYHALEASAQATEYNAGAASGTSYSQPPDLGAYVKQQARAIAPVDAGVVDRETAAQTFFNVLQQRTPKLEQYQ